MKKVIERLEKLNEVIDEYIESGDFEKLLPLLQTRGEILKKLDIKALDEETRLFLQKIVEEDKERIARIEAMAQRFSEKAVNLTEGKKAMLKGYLNLSASAVSLTPGISTRIFIFSAAPTRRTCASV
ncbi:MAG TPA: hypothetical protein DHV12_06600 [Thermotogae bacterium]|nr:hypothetical protein [Thermotogota bacterium]